DRGSGLSPGACHPAPLNRAPRPFVGSVGAGRKVHHGEHNAVTTDTTGPCGCGVCRSFPATKRDKGGFAADPPFDEKSSLKEAIRDGATVSIPSCPL
ncbi:MAG: hypothetical protein ACK51B_07380, partial [bacterium]